MIKYYCDLCNEEIITTTKYKFELKDNCGIINLCKHGDVDLSYEHICSNCYKKIKDLIKDLIKNLKKKC